MDPLFDQPSLDARIGGDRALMRELLALFADIQPGRLVELRRALAQQDLTRARSTAHQIAGAFASLSMDRAARLASATEIALQAQSPAQAQALLARIEAVFAQILERLSAEGLLDTPAQSAGDVPATAQSSR
jgi:HPt (histidine-containing phosphotransfer) domain-containing protein